MIFAVAVDCGTPVGELCRGNTLKKKKNSSARRPLIVVQPFKTFAVGALRNVLRMRAIDFGTHCRPPQKVHDRKSSTSKPSFTIEYSSSLFSLLGHPFGSNKIVEDIITVAQQL